MEHVIAAKAICFGEALKPEYRAYQQKVADNAAALAKALIEEGFDILTGGTDNHLMLVDLRKLGITGKELQNRCDTVGITLNKNGVPDDPQSPFVTSGVRIGTPAVSTRGMGVEEMKQIARLLYLTVKEYDTRADYIRQEVARLCEKYPIYEKGE